MIYQFYFLKTQFISRKVVFLTFLLLCFSSLRANACTPYLDFVSNTPTSTHQGLGSHAITYRLSNRYNSCIGQGFRLGNPQVFRQSGSSWVSVPNNGGVTASFPNFYLNSGSSNYAAVQNLNLSNITQTGLYRIYFEIIGNVAGQLPNLCSSYPGRCRLYMEVNVTSLPTSCPTPTNPHINSGMTSTNTTLDWYGATSVSYYEVRYRRSGTWS